MVARIKGDMDKVDRQLCEAEATVETTMPAPALRSFVPYIFVSALDLKSDFQMKISLPSILMKLLRWPLFRGIILQD